MELLKEVYEVIKEYVKEYVYLFFIKDDYDIIDIYLV